MTPTPLTLLRAGAWTEHAACAGADPTLFDAPSARPWTKVWLTAREAAEQVAHKYCGPCPVIAECAEAADDDYDYGVIRGGSLRDTAHGHNYGAYTAFPLIPQAPPSRHERTSNTSPRSPR